MSMHRRIRTTSLALALTSFGMLWAAQGAEAQVAWDAPMLVAPGSPPGLGIHLVDPEGDGVGALVTWRSQPFPVGIGFRAGLFDGNRSDLGLTAGIDLGGALYRGSDETPVDVVWFTGVGLGIDDGALLSVPLGVSAGWVFADEQVAFRPYVAPRMVLDAYLDDDGPGEGRGRDDDLDLDAAIELGADLAFSSNFIIRAAASFGGRDAVSIGVGLPGR